MLPLPLQKNFPPPASGDVSVRETDFCSTPLAARAVFTVRFLHVHGPKLYLQHPRRTPVA